LHSNRSNNKKQINEARADANEKGPPHAARHAWGVRKLLPRVDLFRALGDCGLEHFLKAQNGFIPQAIMGTDLFCPAKSGMGKMTVFVLVCLQQPDTGQIVVKVRVICDKHDVACQICMRLRGLPSNSQVRTRLQSTATPMAADRALLRDRCPHILISTAGWLLGLLRDKDLKLDKLKQLLVNECNKC